MRQIAFYLFACSIPWLLEGGTSWAATRAHAVRDDCYRRIRQLDEALSVSEAIRMSPKYSFAYLCRGRKYAAKKMDVETRRDWEKTVKLDPQGDSGKLTQEELHERGWAQ